MLSHLDILGFTVMIQATNGLRARACIHLLNGAIGRRVVSNIRDEMAGSGVQISLALMLRHAYLRDLHPKHLSANVA